MYEIELKAAKTKYEAEIVMIESMTTFGRGILNTVEKTLNESKNDDEIASINTVEKIINETRNDDEITPINTEEKTLNETENDDEIDPVIWWTICILCEEVLENYPNTENHLCMF